MSISHVTAPGRNMSGPGVLGVVVLTRVCTAVLWRLREWEMGDTFYYLTKVTEVGERGLTATMTEYPIPVVWLLQLPTWAGTSHNAYLGAFASLMIAFDLAFCLLLWTRGGRHRGAAICVWSVFLMAVGPLLWLRFDLVPAVLVGAAAVFATTRPAVAGALLAVGAAVKLWPGSLLVFLMHRRTRLLAIGGFVSAGGALLLACLAAGGIDRLFSPLDWQSGRGLQIESVWATPLMLARAFSDGDWTVTYSRWQAFEVFGPGVSVWLAIAAVATVFGGLICLALMWRTATSVRPDGPAISATILAAIAIIIVTNKTLSPQYIVWLGAPVVALVARVGLRGRTRHSVSPSEVRRWALAVVAIALLSQAIYPWLYDALIGYQPDPPFEGTVALLLAARNVLLVWLTVDACVGAWRAVAVRPAAITVHHRPRHEGPAGPDSAQVPAGRDMTAGQIRPVPRPRSP